MCKCTSSSTDGDDVQRHRKHSKSEGGKCTQGGPSLTKGATLLAAKSNFTEYQSVKTGGKSHLYPPVLMSVMIRTHNL